jgi:hypothetical protein
MGSSTSRPVRYVARCTLAGAVGGLLGAIAGVALEACRRA